VNNPNGSLISLIQSALPNPWVGFQPLQAVNSNAGPVYPTAVYTSGSGFCPECVTRTNRPFYPFYASSPDLRGYSGLSVLRAGWKETRNWSYWAGSSFSAELCDNAIDDDGDGLADCEDTECRMANPVSSTCFDGQDNDADGLMTVGMGPRGRRFEMRGPRQRHYIPDSLEADTVSGDLAYYRIRLFWRDVARDMERSWPSGMRQFDWGIDLVLDGFGVVHFVAETDATIPVDFYFQETSEFPSGRAVDVVVSFDNLGLWVLTDFGGIFRAGTAKAPNDPAQVPGDASLLPLGVDVPYGDLRDPGLPNPGGASLRAVSLVVLDLERDSRADGYIVVDSQGGRFHLQPNGAPFLAGSLEVSTIPSGYWIRPGMYGRSSTVWTLRATRSLHRSGFA
jgi:hypothetical protein